MENYPNKSIPEHMLERRRVFLWGEITDKNTREVIDRLRYLADLSHEDIYLYIHSEGGDTECADAIIDEIQGMIARGINVETVGMGRAQSAACFIISMGTPGRRFAFPNCSLMLHPVSYDFGKDYVDQQERMAAFSKKKADILIKKVAEACGKGTGKKLGKFKQDIDKGLWLTTQEAMKYGVIDGVWNYKWEDEINSKAKGQPSIEQGN